MVQIIKVAPVEAGWSVHYEGLSEPALYLSGGKAEAIARTTARRLAAAGLDVRVDVEDRSRRQVGSHTFRGR